MKIDVAAVRNSLKSFDFETLFYEHLGWDKHQPAPRQDGVWDMSRKTATQGSDYLLVLFTSPDGAVTIPATLDRETVWLSQAQMAALFDKERSVITKHIRNAMQEGEIDDKSNVHFLHIPLAESKPAEREMMVNLVMTFLAEDDAALTSETRK